MFGRGCGWPGPVGFLVVPWGWGVSWGVLGFSVLLRAAGRQARRWEMALAWQLGGDVGNRKNGV